MPTRRNYLQIVQDGRTRLEKNTPVNNFNSQGITKSLVDMLGVEVEKQYNILEYIYNSIDPTKAVGSDLEKIGFMLGENRDDSVTASDYSTTNFYFYIDPRINLSLNNLIKNNYSSTERTALKNAGFITVNTLGDVESLKIPKGHLVFNVDQTIGYSTINDVFLTNSDSYVGIVAAASGPQNNVSTNSLIAHSIQQIPELRKISHFIKCSNRYPIQNGSYSMNDAEYRYKISTSRSAIRANELSIRRAALSVPGIRDILFEKNKYGNGTVSIIVDGVSPLVSQGLIDAVKERIQMEMSYGDTVFVDRPEYLGVEINLGIIIENGSFDEFSIRQQIRDNIIQYINDLPIGGEIIWNRIIDVSFNVQGVKDIVPKIFKYGEYDSLNKINKNQTILRFQNQRADALSKWYTDSGLMQCCTI